MATKTQSPASTDTVTGAAFAVAVITRAITALSRANGAVWRAVQEAAGAFPATMTEHDKAVLSGALARDYRAKAGLDNAAVLASQHARAIFLIATAAKGADGTHPDASKFSNMSAYFGAFSAKKSGGTPAVHPGATVTGGTSPVHRVEGDPINPAPVANAASAQIGAMVTAEVVSIHGLPAEVQAAIQTLITMARGKPELADSLVMVANNPALILTTCKNEVARLNGLQVEKTVMAQALTAAGVSVQLRNKKAA